MATRAKPAAKVGKYVLGYYYTNRSKKYVYTVDQETYTTKDAALKAAEALLNSRSYDYDEILILEVTSKVVFERVPVKVVEVE